MIDWQDLCKAISFYRESKKIPIDTIARATGYSINTIYGFEKGRNKNALILLWYLEDGFTLDMVNKILDVEKSINSSTR